MYLEQLPINKPSHSKKQNIKIGDYYVVQKANEPALIFRCLAANDIEVTSDDTNHKSHGQYESFLLEVTDNETVLRLKERCAQDHYRWINRLGIGNKGKIDLSVLGTKFKTK